jgi:Predicted glycosyltransferases
MNLLSIIIPYYNRRDILLNTLSSINLFSGDYPIETIVVDDGSDIGEWVDCAVDMFPKLNINLIYLRRPKAVWRGPTIAYNMGFNEAKGDVIFLNGVDCMHCGDLVGYVFRHMKENMYMNFSAYRGTNNINEVLKTFDWYDTAEMESLKGSFDLTRAENWHIHSKFFYELAPFCAAINRSDMERLGGMDERFEQGVGYEDSDFTDRVKNLGLNAVMVDEPFCLHQRHKFTDYTNPTNRKLLYQLRADAPQRIKATQNKIYIR